MVLRDSLVLPARGRHLAISVDSFVVSTGVCVGRYWHLMGSAASLSVLQCVGMAQPRRPGAPPLTNVGRYGLSWRKITSSWAVSGIPHSQSTATSEQDLAIAEVSALSALPERWPPNAHNRKKLVSMTGDGHSPQHITWAGGPYKPGFWGNHAFLTWTTSITNFLQETQTILKILSSRSTARSCGQTSFQQEILDSTMTHFLRESPPQLLGHTIYFEQVWSISSFSKSSTGQLTPLTHSSCHFLLMLCSYTRVTVFVPHPQR